MCTLAPSLSVEYDCKDTSAETEILYFVSSHFDYVITNLDSKIRRLYLYGMYFPLRYLHHVDGPVSVRHLSKGHQDGRWEEGQPAETVWCCTP